MALFFSYFSGGGIFYFFRGQFQWKLSLLQILLSILPTFLVAIYWMKPEYLCDTLLTDLDFKLGAVFLYLPLLIFLPDFYLFLLTLVFCPLSFALIKQYSDQYLMKRNQALR